jgi:RNA recognition motif-containing protein
MGKKLHVGNLSYDFKASDLEDIFKKIGEVKSVKLITDLETGKSKGFAFVEMATSEDAAAALQKLNGKEVGGRPLKISEANPREEGTGNRFGGNRTGGFGKNFGNKKNQE